MVGWGLGNGLRVRKTRILLLGFDEARQEVPPVEIFFFFADVFCDFGRHALALLGAGGGEGDDGGGGARAEAAEDRVLVPEVVGPGHLADLRFS